MARFDVAVVGAGLAGLVAAHGLAEKGLRVLLIDRKRSLANGVHTTGIFVRRTLESYADALPEAFLGPPIFDVKLYSPARRTIALRSAQPEFRIGDMGAIYLHLLARAEKAGVTYAGETSFLGGEFSESIAGGAWRLRLEGAGAPRTEARFLIGADGARSRVADLLGLDANRHWLIGVEDVFRDTAAAQRSPDESEAFDDEDAPPSIHCFLDPELAPGYIAWIARDGRTIHVGLAGYASRFRPAEMLERFRQSIRPIVDTARHPFVERRGGRIPVGGILRRIASERGLLIGDAAGAVSPLSAGGLDPCFRLTQLAVAATRDWLVDHDAAALAAYNGNRFRRKFMARSWARRVYGAVRQRWLLEAGCWAIRFTPLRAAARHVFFGRGSFPDVRYRPHSRPLAAAEPIV